MKALVRKHSTKTARASAKKAKPRYKQVLSMIRQLGLATCDQVILAMKKKELEKGKTLREDPISGTFNLLCLKGLIAPNGEQDDNSSGHKAMLWRVTTPEEKEFIQRYVGTDTVPWPSPDTLLAIPEVRKVLKNHPNAEYRKMYRRYRKGILFKTVFKDKGISWFMKNYETNGSKKQH